MHWYWYAIKTGTEPKGLIHVAIRIGMVVVYQFWPAGGCLVHDHCSDYWGAPRAGDTLIIQVTISVICHSINVIIPTWQSGLLQLNFVWQTLNPLIQCGKLHPIVIL